MQHSLANVRLGIVTACATAPIELADVKRNERIFDVATGTWALLQELARHVHVKHVVGIDGSPAMLSGARCHRIAAQFVVAVGRELPFPRASFDVVFVTYLLQLARPSERARCSRLSLTCCGVVVVS